MFSLLDDFDHVRTDLEKLKMWEPLQELLTSPLTSDGIKMQTLWVIGTAVQNNPSAQNAVGYLSNDIMDNAFSESIMISICQNPQCQY